MKFKNVQYSKGYKLKLGMTLVELMVAMVISLIIMLAIGTVYTSSKRSYSVQNAYANMQEGALYAFQYLGRSVRSAGYAGCNPVIKNHLNTTAKNNVLFNYIDGVYGWDYKGTGPGGAYTIPSNIVTSNNAVQWSDGSGNNLYSSLAGKTIPGSDILVVKGTQMYPLTAPSSNLAATSPSITFQSDTGIKQGQIVLIGDCVGADLFQNSAPTTTNTQTLSAGTACGINPVTQKANTPCNTGTGWSHYYHSSTIHLYKSTATAYYVGLNHDKVPALYSYVYADGLNSTPKELVDGVENMQVLYGESVNIPDTANHFVPITQIPTKDLSKIYAIRISLLVRTTQKVNVNTPANPTTYNLVGVDNKTAVQITAPKDTYLRHVYTATINLPNMAIRRR